MILIESLTTVKLFLGAKTRLGRVHRISEHMRKPKSVKLSRTVDTDSFYRRTVQGLVSLRTSFHGDMGKIMKRPLVLLLLPLIFFSSLLVTPILGSKTSIAASDLGQEKSSVDTQVLMKQASVTPRTVRVAIYNETNTTLPQYASEGLLSGNVSSVQAVLQAAGHRVTLLGKNDILNHHLKTAFYDVFILVDNLPREAIFDQVKEFWLGGGGVLSLDSGISYLCYAGMIPPESEGSENHHV